MKRSTGKIVAIALLAAFIGWLVFTSIPVGKEKNSHGNSGAVYEYEPKFTKEGELWITSGESSDTIKKLDIEIADNETETQYGMMYRKSMDPSTGMLFIMPVERMQSFWMKNTYVSLDIIYINSNFEIVSIQKNAVPKSEESLPSEGPALYVLEIPGGFADELGLKKGDKISFKRI